VFHELGAEVITIGNKPDGYNINDKVGATAPEALVAAVKEHRADYGIALDGDADRLQMVDGDGRLYNGDELLYVMVADRLARGERVPGAVGTLMTNMAVELALRQRDVEFVRAKVGDRYVLEELAARGWQLGGEGSGHLLALDRHTTGDGIVSSLLVLEAVCRSGRRLVDLLDGVSLFPQTLINVRLQADQQDWKSNPALARTEADAARHGRGERRRTGAALRGTSGRRDPQLSLGSLGGTRRSGGAEPEKECRWRESVGGFFSGSSPQHAPTPSSKGASARSVEPRNEDDNGVNRI
jgi:phosphoglucosamine mutase